MQKMILFLLLCVAHISWAEPMEQASGPQLYQSDVFYIQDTAVDILATMVCTLIFPISQTYFDPIELTETGDAVKDIPIVLVHGFMHNSSGMIMHRKKLNEAGFKNVFTVDLGVLPFSKSIENFADILSQRIEEVLKDRPVKEIRLVGHSMGGVVSAHYALRMAEKNAVTVRDVITLGSPLRGTKVTIFCIAECASQMAYESHFITQLSREITESELNFHHFASKTDLIMRPYHTALNGLEGKSPRNYLFELGHVSFLFSSQVCEQIIEIFEKPPTDSSY